MRIFFSPMTQALIALGIALGGTLVLIAGAMLVRLILSILGTDPERRRLRTIWISYMLYIAGMVALILYESIKSEFYWESLLYFAPLILVPLLGLGIRLAFRRAQ